MKEKGTAIKCQDSVDKLISVLVYIYIYIHVVGVVRLAISTTHLGDYCFVVFI